MKKVILVLLLCYCVGVYAQLKNETLKDLYSNIQVEEKYKPNKLHLTQLCYLRNNEYFELINPGETYFGTQLYAYTNLNIKNKKPGFALRLGGFVNQTFGGEKGGLTLLPLISTSYTDSVQHIEFGALQAHVNHGMHDAMYSYENAFTNAVEYGASYLRLKTKHKLETWLEWRSAMDLDKARQEKIIWGLNTALNLKLHGNTRLSLPWQTLIYHQGGQGIDAPIATRITSMMGVGLQNRKWQVGQLIFGSVDNSPQIAQAFKQGYALYTYAAILHKNHTVHAGYWQAQQFVNTLGNGIFTNVNINYPYANMQNRRIVSVRYNFTKKWSPYYQLDFRVEPFYNLENKGFSHSESLFFKAFWN